MEPHPQHHTVGDRTRAGRPIPEPPSRCTRFLDRLDAHLAGLADEQARRTFLDRQLDAWQRRYGRFISTHGACESIGDPADPPQAADFLVTIAALAARRRALSATKA